MKHNAQYEITKAIREYGYISKKRHLKMFTFHLKLVL